MKFPVEIRKGDKKKETKNENVIKWVSRATNPFENQLIGNFSLTHFPNLAPTPFNYLKQIHRILKDRI